MAKNKFEAELLLNSKGFVDALSQADGAIGKFGKQLGRMSLAIGAAGAVFGVLINWFKETAAGAEVMNVSLAVSKQLLTDIIMGQGFHLKEAFKNAKAQTKINEDNAVQGYQLAKMHKELNLLVVAAADQTKSLAEKKEILTKAMAKEREIKEFLIKDAKEERKVLWDVWQANLANTKAREDFYKAAARLEEVQGMASRGLMSQYTAVLEQQAQRARDLAEAFTPLPEDVAESNRQIKLFTERTIDLASALDLAATANRKLNFPSVGIPAGNTLSPNKTVVGQSSALFSWFDATSEWKGLWESAIMEVTSFMADTFGEVFERIGEGSFQGFGENLLGNFGNLIKSLGKMLMLFGSLWLAALTLMKAPTIPTAIAAIAIGAAAVGVGSLMIGASKRAASNISGGGSTTQQSVNVQGVIKGRDIYLSSQRYVNELNVGS